MQKIYCSVRNCRCVSQKDDNSPIIHVSVDDIKRELDNPGVGVNEVVGVN